MHHRPGRNAGLGRPAPDVPRRPARRSYRVLAALRVLIRTPKLWIALLVSPACCCTALIDRCARTPPLSAEPAAALQRAFKSSRELPSTRPGLAAGGTTGIRRYCGGARPRLPASRAALGTARMDAQEPDAARRYEQSQPWRRWARGRIFDQHRCRGRSGRRAMGKRDMADLRATMALRPMERRSSSCCAHARASADGPRRPASTGREAGTGPPRPQALDGLRLAIGGPAEPLDLSVRPQSLGTPKGSRWEALLGLKADDDERLAPLRGNIRDGKWSPSDILPMLVIGSTPSSRCG